MNSNFIFLQEDYSLLYNIAYLSEKNLYSDSNIGISRHYAPTMPTAPQNRYANFLPQSYTLFWLGKENCGILKTNFVKVLKTLTK